MEPIPESVGTVVGERRRMPRYHLLTRVDILVAGSGDAYWGSMRNLSRSGVAVTVRQHLRPHQRVTVCFHHQRDRKSTRLNSSHGYISYAVFCFKKKKKKRKQNYRNVD